MIETGLSGEAGANPARARRRKAPFATVLTKMPQFGKSHWKSVPRRMVSGVPSRNIQTTPILLAYQPELRAPVYGRK